MTTIRRSALFKRQLLQITGGYRDRAGSDIALRFVDEIDEGINFIAERPYACAIYTRIEGQEFRKWRIGSFPVSAFFRIDTTGAIVLEALYAHRMNIDQRFVEEVEQPDL
jgi:plasmid stabilization system protein ParE